MASVLSWSAARALGRQLRIDAAVSADHRLIKSGPYALVRHPIYTSMLCVVIATGLLITPVYLFIAALAVYFIGTEIRIRVEDNLLAARFADEFKAYQNRVPALIPFVR